MHRFFQILFMVSIGAFACAGIFYYNHDIANTGVAMVSAFILMAVAFRGFEKLKAFSYTIWILAAVAAAMFYPGTFISVGNFQLKTLIVPFVQLTMFGMGAQMSFEDFKGVVKMPKGVLIGIFCHYTMMPMVGFLLSKTFYFPPEIAGGIILIGCVPSAMASNVMSYLAKANLALAVTIGACSTILSPFLTPVLMKMLGGQYVKVEIAAMMIDITNMIIIPVTAGFIFNLFYYNNESKRSKKIQLIVFALIVLATNFLMSLTVKSGVTGFLAGTLKSAGWFYFLPMIAAMVLRRMKNLSRADIENSLAFLAMLGIVINTLIITASGRDNLLLVGGLLILTCFLHNITGFSLGYFLAKLFGMPEKDRRTIAFEVGMQNGGVATGLALQMGKVATVGLASAIFGPLQNLTGSALANWFRKHPPQEEIKVVKQDDPQVSQIAEAKNM